MQTTNYFQFEVDIAQTHLIPLLEPTQALRGTVLDVGCGYGGVLFALKQHAPTIKGIGLDLDAEMVGEGRKRVHAEVQLETQNFFDVKQGAYDLILMRDVLEHIREPTQALSHAFALLRPGGFLYASFAPFYGPFGGHQHNGSGVFSHIPWLHLLPQNVFRHLLPIKGNAYKNATALEADMDSVCSTRLTHHQFLTASRQLGFNKIHTQAYLSRPDYRLKFGWPTIKLPRLLAFSDFLATGIESLLQKPMDSNHIP